MDVYPSKNGGHCLGKRHPKLPFRMPESLSSKRKNMSVSIIKQRSHTTKDYFIVINGMDALTDPSRNLNIHEFGFSQSPVHGKVLAEKGMKNVFEDVSSFQKTNITVLGCVCTNGAIPPYMILYPRNNRKTRV